jgi:hypothetical protein
MKVVKGFKDVSVPDQLARALMIIRRTKDNPHFPDAEELIEELQQAHDNLAKDYRDSRQGDLRVMASMRVRRQELLKAVDNLAAYVRVKSKGDPLIILSSGFDIPKKAVAQNELAQVMKQRITKRQQGAVKICWQAVTGRLLYMIEICKGKHNGIYQAHAFSSKPRYVITKLNASGDYWIRITAIGKDGMMGAPSNPLRIPFYKL